MQVNKKNLRRMCVLGDLNIYNKSLENEVVNLAIDMTFNDIGLVYNGYPNNLIKKMLNIVEKENGHSTSILLKINDGLVNNSLNFNESYEINDIHEYKMFLFNISDGFIIFPSGIFVLDIIMEYFTWMQRIYKPKPIYIVNIDDFWEPLIKMFRNMRREFFLPEDFDDRYIIVNEINCILKDFNTNVK